MPPRPKRPSKLHKRLATEAAAVDLGTFTLRVPIRVLLGEALAMFRLARDHSNPRMDPATHAITVPSLELFGDARLPDTITTELLALHTLVASAQTSYARAVTLPRENPARAALVLDELSAGLHWLCDETPHSDQHTKLAAITIRGHAPVRTDAIANLLADHLALAIQLQGELENLPAFDPQLIHEARHLVDRLRRRPALHCVPHEALALVQQRNRYASVLLRRIDHVRAVARYVFRNHDDIVREVSGAYRHRGAAIAPPAVPRRGMPRGVPASSEAWSPDCRAVS